jgi:general secretion pathway protein F
MRTFEYRAYDSKGRRVHGWIEADSPKVARERLAAQGLLAESLVTVEARAGRRDRWRREADRSAVYHELSALHRAGFPLLQALDLLVASPEWSALRGWLAQIRDRIREGASTADSLRAVGVSELEAAVIHAGERSGELGEALRRAAVMLEDQDRLVDRIRSALMYPTIVVVLAMMLGAGVLGFLLPAFAKMFEESRVPLPWITRAVLGVAGFFRRYGLLLGVAVIGVGLAVRAKVRQSRSWRVRVERWVSRGPLVGELFSAMVALRWARTLAQLLRGGATLIEALPMAAAASGSAWLSSVTVEEVEAIRHGGSLRDSVRRLPLVRELLGVWIEAGEHGGDLPGMLDLGAARCEELWERRTTRALAWLEPALIIILGMLVFILALAIVLPILQLNRQLS